MTTRGFSLVELLAVISIIGILAVALGFFYVGWQGAYRVEKMTKDLYTDLMDAQTRAMNQSRAFFVVINANSYSIVEDANDNAVNDDPALPAFPKQVDFALNEDIVGNMITFNKRGVATVTDPVDNIDNIWFTLPANVNPDYDCIAISNVRINMGIMNAGNCNAK